MSEERLSLTAQGHVRYRLKTPYRDGTVATEARGLELGKAAEANLLGAPHMIRRHADGTEEWMAFFKYPERRPLTLMSLAKK